ncbi:MAG: YsnF/AvaK domain-containing protein [Pyrinomonadaceae bacterium]
MIDASAPAPESEGGQDVIVILESGQRVKVPYSQLTKRAEGGYALAMSFVEAERQTNTAVARQAGETLVVPVIEEELQIAKRRVETGRVRLTKTVHEREETFAEPLAQEEVNIERVAVNRIVEGPLPEPRYEGDTMVIPLFEEVMVMEKKVILKEELRITKRRFETRSSQRVLLRREEVSVDRLRGSDHATE